MPKRQKTKGNERKRGGGREISGGGTMDKNRTWIGIEKARREGDREQEVPLEVWGEGGL
jgi:hypothetical protein